MSLESTRWKKWRMDISKKKESMSMTKNYKGGMPTSKRYFSAWKGLYLLRMKIKFVLPSKWIHAQCNICFLAPWQDVISKIAHLHTSVVMRLWDLCCFSSFIHVICWALLVEFWKIVCSCEQTWNLSKNLHDPICGRKNFTHWKRLNWDYFRHQ